MRRSRKPLGAVPSLESSNLSPSASRSRDPPGRAGLGHPRPGSHQSLYLSRLMKKPRPVEMLQQRIPSDRDPHRNRPGSCHQVILDELPPADVATRTGESVARPVLRERERPLGGAHRRAVADDDPEEEKTLHASTPEDDDESSQRTRAVARSRPPRRADDRAPRGSPRPDRYGAREVEPKPLSPRIEASEGRLDE